MANCELFYFIVWGVLGTMICCFGFIGNMLSLVTFQKERRVPATTLLQCLASSDFMLLLSVLVTDALPYICDYSGTCDNPWTTWPYIRYIWLLTPISHMCSIWFVVLIALNRYFAVCQPHQVNTVWDNKKTPIYVTCVLVLVISFNFPRFFEYEIVEGVDEKTNATILKEKKTDFGNTTSYQIAYKQMLVNILLVMLPIAALIVLTALILRGLAQQRKRLAAKRTPSVKNTNSSIKLKGGRSRSGSEITFVLVVVVIVAIICQTPLAAFHFIRHKFKYDCGQVVFYLNNISKLLVNVNSCINFIIYCVASPKFRGVLMLVVTCSLADKIGPTRTASTLRKDNKNNGTHNADDTGV